jgi:hypothetical protein
VASLQSQLPLTDGWWEDPTLVSGSHRLVIGSGQVPTIYLLRPAAIVTARVAVCAEGHQGYRREISWHQEENVSNLPFCPLMILILLWLASQSNMPVAKPSLIFGNMKVAMGVNLYYIAAYYHFGLSL